MIYRLKDHEYQKRMDEVSGGTFSKGLRNATFNPKTDHICVTFSTVKERNFKLINNMMPIKRDQLEETDEFDRRDWNDYPFVTPPLGLWMRCEMDSVGAGTIRFGAIFRAGADGLGEWRDSEGVCVHVDRFRPWED